MPVSHLAGFRLWFRAGWVSDAGSARRPSAAEPGVPAGPGGESPGIILSEKYKLHVGKRKFHRLQTGFGLLK